MESKEELIKQYNEVNNLLIDEVENLKHLLEFQLISNINLLNIHYTIKELLNKRDSISNKLFYDYQMIIIDEV